MITSPTLLVDEQKCRANIRAMARKAARHDLEFKPHFKTHQSADIGEWFREVGVEGITVSSIKMANYFHQHGWKDITIAFPVNLREMDAINRLASEITLTLLISDPTVISQLDNLLSAPVGVFIEIDTGSSRTGFKLNDKDLLDHTLEEIQKAKKLHFKGFYSHPGHSYASRSTEQIQEIYADVLTQCRKLKQKYSNLDEDWLICIGDTPCCSVAEEFDPIDQISPGNFVFYDVMQSEIGSCKISDIAVALALPIVAKYPSRNELVVHGGAIHLSKEVFRSQDPPHFGLPVLLNEDYSWLEPIEHCYVKSISQEHGIVSCKSPEFDKLQIGDLIGILPVHSCLTADLMGEYRTLEGNILNHIRK